MMHTQPTQPLISVVMPVYNGAPYLGAAIESILTQTQSDFEFIIADDGSTDDSAAIIHTFATRDARIRPLFLEHGGQATAGNACVMTARGRWLARMDADDLALPERLAIQLAWLQQSQVAIGGCAYVKQFGHDARILWFPESHSAIQRDLLFRVGLLQATMMLPTALAQAHLYQAGRAFEDYEWQTRLALTHRFGNLPQILLQRRSHATQVHVQRHADFKADLRAYRRPYFFKLYPQATADDYAALARVLDREACVSLTELKRAGVWLVRLATGQELRLRVKLAERWQATCRHSAGLGFGCYAIYQQLLPQFQAPSVTTPFWLWLSCALHLREQSALRRSYQASRRTIDHLIPSTALRTSSQVRGQR